MPKCDAQDIISEENQPLKILIGTKEIEVGDACDWSGGFVKHVPVKPSNECVGKQIIYIPPPPKDLQPGDHVQIWTDQCQYDGRRMPPVWVGPFVIDRLWGSLGYFVSIPSGLHPPVTVYREHVRRYCFHPRFDPP